MKNKNSILYDFKEISKKLDCGGLTISCSECKNKKLCDTVEDIIKYIGCLYDESK